MSLYNYHDEFKCALNDDHIYKEPIILSCGHFTCKNCVPIKLNIQQDDHIKCKLCGEINYFDLHDQKYCNIAEYSIERNISKLFDYMQAKMIETFDNLKSKIDQNSSPFYI